MSIIMMEGFETQATSGNVLIPNGKFSSIGTNTKATAGRITGLAGGFVSSAVGQNVYFPLPKMTASILGIAIRMDTLTATGRGFAFYENGNEGVGFGVNSNGALTVNRNTTVLYTGTAGDIVAGTWYYIELSVSGIATSGITIILRKNAVVQTTLTNQNSRPSSNLWVDMFTIFGQGTTGYLPSFDDLYILDTAGSANNAFLGKQKVTLLVPTADSGSQQWTTSSGGNHYNRVSDVPPDSDTTYIEDNVSGHVDLFDVTDPHLNSIAGVQINAVMKETDAASLTVNLQCVSGATTSNGTAVPAGGPSYNTQSRILESDPNTSAAWLNSALTSAKFGVKIP